ncbi:MAG TPA: mercuric reductase [Candidatus Acidoferrum sp.]|jgi:pyruvate/2-oxoglutarate dehydrogenase complex dihydrolipoamide dehydrogenase (E3) component|nr:mercuric reductase [Candidatus Acidoferrum sp.]
MKYDAIIVGSGQGGNPLAFRLADLGWPIALIEEKNLGGTCINVGCTPTKTMVHRAQVAHYARNGSRWGVNAANVTVDLAKIVAQKDEVVLSFRGGQQRRVDERKNLRLYRGHARFVGPHQLKIGDDLLESEKIFIDVGGRPNIPAIAGLSDVPFLTNESLMQLTAVPEHLLILGGGYIGLEFGQMFRRYGSRVTVIHRGRQIVPLEDLEIAAELQKALEAEGLQFVLNARTEQVRQKNGAITLSCKISTSESAVTGSHLLVATGRIPNTGDLGLDKAGIGLNKDGSIKVNNKLETSVPGVWALGDCKGGPAFTHISYNDFQIVYGNLVEGKSLSIENRIVPYCVFTDPQLGGVGLTEKEGRARGYKLKIGKCPMANVARAIERGETAGLMKIVVDASNDRILGASILASEGGELVQILGAVMLANQPYTLLKGAVYIHPTLAEGFFALMEDVKPVD